jgi:hypothetical protein
MGNVGLSKSAGLLGIAIAAACGGDEDLTCDLLAETTNCWAQAAAALATCMPMRATPATLAADRSSCMFSDGVRVVFDTPLPNSTPELERLGFNIEVGGSRCARFVDTFDDRMELTGGGKTVISELHPGSEFHVHCPDGTTYSADFQLLFECQAPAVAPTDGFNVTPTTFTFSISSATTTGTLFRCTL